MKTTTRTINTVGKLKTDVFDAIRQGHLIGAGSTRSFESFDMAIDAFVNCYGETLAPKAVPALRTRKAWLNELQAA